MRQKEKADFLKQLGMLLKAGIPLSRSIDILAEGKQKKNASQILQKLQAGASFSESWDWGGEIKALISVGEQNGQLEEALQRAARQIEGRLIFKDKIKKALSYPILVLFLSLICFMLVLIFVLPTFANIFSDFDYRLPPLTVFVLNLSRIWFVFPVSILLLLVFAFKIFRSDVRFRLSFFKYVFFSEFCRSLGEQLKNGVPILKAFKILEHATPHKFFKNKFSAVYQALESGQKLNASLGTYFPDSLKRMVAVGEESGSLDLILLQAADIYSEKVESLIKSFTLILEPASTIFVGAFVGFIALAMLMPLFSMVNSLL